MSKYSFIIPIYNEELTIAKVIQDIKKKCTDISNIEKYEILVIDDNSTDNSGNIVSEFNEVKYIKNLSNFGYGFSLKIGIRQAIYPNIIILDGDGTYPIDYLHKMIDKYLGA